MVSKKAIFLHNSCKIENKNCFKNHKLISLNKILTLNLTDNFIYFFENRAIRIVIRILKVDLSLPFFNKLDLNFYRVKLFKSNTYLKRFDFFV